MLPTVELLTCYFYMPCLQVYYTPYPFRAAMLGTNVCNITNLKKELGSQELQICLSLLVGAYELLHNLTGAELEPIEEI